MSRIARLPVLLLCGKDFSLNYLPCLTWILLFLLDTKEKGRESGLNIAGFMVSHINHANRT